MMMAWKHWFCMWDWHGKIIFIVTWSCHGV
jgi:hypothetical protein